MQKNILFVRGDIRDKRKVLKAFKGADAVIHLAYVNGTKHFYNQPVKVLDIAIKGILNVIESCIVNNIKELYLASSSEVYQTPNKIPTDEMEMLKKSRHIQSKIFLWRWENPYRINGNKLRKIF